MFFPRLSALKLDPCFKIVIADFYHGDVYAQNYNLVSHMGFLKDIKALFDMSLFADVVQEDG